MARSCFRSSMVALGVATMLFAGVSQAQWALVAKRAIGRVEQMSQQSKDAGGASYDSAAVMLDAPADKVYLAVVRGVNGASDKGIRITREDATDRVIQFTNGVQIAGIKVSPLSDDLSHLLVTSAHSGTQPNAAALVMDSILRVCREMNVACSAATQ